jgi:hypothetical protein
VQLLEVLRLRLLLREATLRSGRRDIEQLWRLFLHRRGSIDSTLADAAGFTLHRSAVVPLSEVIQKR